MSEPMDATTADTIAAVSAASDHRGWIRGYQAGFVAGNDSAVAKAQLVVDELQGEITRLRDFLPATSGLALLEGGKETPDA
jgi:hypothetical protein